jgi:hypothetical protein
MPVHDWTRVDDGTFHSFHNGWIAHLSESLNAGLLPKGYYSLAEQHALHYVADVLTLRTKEESGDRGPAGGVSVLEAPPKVSQRQSMQPPYEMLRRTLTIRRTTNHRIVALIEIISPGNKRSRQKVQEFVDKATDALRHGIHLLVVDILPPTRIAPRGIHGAIWRRWYDEDFPLPKDQPFTLSAYQSHRFEPVEAWYEHLAVGDTMTDMPLFLREEAYINVPLQAAYNRAFRGIPEIFRAVLEKGTNGKRRKR